MNVTRSLLILLTTVGLLGAAGCFERAERKASRRIGRDINETVRKLDLYSGSREEVLSGGAKEVILEALNQLPDNESGQEARNANKKIEEISKKQQEDLGKTLDRLKTALAEAPADTAAYSLAPALGRSLLAGTLTGQSLLKLNAFKVNTAAVLGAQEAVRVTALDIRDLKNQLDTLKKQSLTEPISKLQDEIKAAEAARAKTQEEMTAVEKSIDYVQKELAANKSEQKTIDEEISRQSVGLGSLSPSKAMDQLKKIQELERKRFALSVMITRLESGPYRLPDAAQPTVDGRKLVDVNGLQQLNEERAVVKTRLESSDAAIKTQQDYVANLQKEDEILAQKRQNLAAQIDALGPHLAKALEALADAVARDDTLADACLQEIRKAQDMAKRAPEDAKKYLKGLKDQATALPAGQKSPYLDDAMAAAAEAIVPTSLARIALQLAEAEALTHQLRQLQMLEPILKLAQAQGALPEILAKRLADVAQTTQDLTAKIDTLVQDAVAQAEQLEKDAKNGEVKALCSLELAAVCVQGSTLAVTNPGNLSDRAKQAIEGLKEFKPGSREQGLLTELRKFLGM